MCASLHTHARGEKHTHSETLSSVCSWTWRPHCSFHLPTPFSACCWHHYVNTNTIFLSSSPGRSVPLISLFLLRAFGEWQWGPEGIWDMGELWETRVQSVASQHAALSLSSRSPSLSLSLFLFWQRIIGGFMQIAYCGLKWSGKTCPVNAMCTSEPCSTLKQCTHSLCLFLWACVWLWLCVFYLHIVFGVAPVPLGVQVAQAETLQLAKVNLCHRTADLTRHKVWTYNTYIKSALLASSEFNYSLHGV